MKLYIFWCVSFYPGMWKFKIRYLCLSQCYCEGSEWKESWKNLGTFYLPYFRYLRKNEYLFLGTHLAEGILHVKLDNVPLWIVRVAKWNQCYINHLRTKISAFYIILKRRICLKIRSFLNCWSFPIFSWPLHLIKGWYCEEKLELSQS